MPRTLRFYFDFSSPYGYLATARIDDLAQRDDCKVDWRAHLLGVAMKATGQKPLLNQPLRGAYAQHDLNRMARDFGLPLVQPDVFPIHSVAASRAFYALKDDEDGQSDFLARQLFHAYWGEGRDISRPDDIAREAAAIGMDGEALIQRMALPETRQRLREEVDDAMERGIFGSPMFDIDGELFWGCDKFDQMDRWLAAGGW